MIAPYLHELTSPTLPLAIGAMGLGVKRVQEWLSFAHFTLEIDGAFGEATRQAVMAFQHHSGNMPSGEPTGIVNAATWGALSAPLARANAVPSLTDKTFGETVVRVARQHLEQGPREIGGQNRGPWPRHYCRGVDGQPWCAGFTTSVQLQAARRLGIDSDSTPFPLADENGIVSLWVPWLANAAKAADKFQSGATAKPVPPGSMFFVPGAPSYSHVGIVIHDAGDVIESIEGNYQDAVIRRFRRHRDLDFGLST